MEGDVPRMHKGIPVKGRPMKIPFGVQWIPEALNVGAAALSTQGHC